MPRTIEEILQDVPIAEISLKLAVRTSPDTPLERVYRLLEESPHGAVLICEGERVTGIFTERDVLNRTVLEDLDPATPIRDLMKEDPVTLARADLLAAAVRIMTERGYRHIPLVDAEGHFQGLLASRDVLRFIAEHYPEAVLNLPPRLHQVMLTPEGG